MFLFSVRTVGLPYLHPEKETLGASFELEHVHTSCGTLRNPFELTVIRENYEVL